jgi:hypothetical protein
VRGEQLLQGADVDAVLLAPLARELAQGGARAGAGSIDRRPPPVPVGDRRDALPRIATVEAASLPFAHAEKPRRVAWAQGTGRQAG